MCPESSAWLFVGVFFRARVEAKKLLVRVQDTRERNCRNASLVHSPQRLSSAAARGRACLVGAPLECDLQSSAHGRTGAES